MLEWLKSLFKKSQSPPALALAVVIDSAQQNVKDKIMTELHFEDAIKIALEISSDFEGDGGFANIVGDFDGQCLTCGALGWTWKLGDQQKMVLYCEKLYPGVVEKYMPTLGKNYLFLCSKPIIGTAAEVSSWSHGSRVDQPQRSELAAFWGSTEMTGVQTYYAKTIANKAMKYAAEWSVAKENGSSLASTVEVTLQEFCFFFDVVVNNGSMTGLVYKDASDRIRASGEPGVKEEIVHWCLAQTSKDCQKNADYWEKIDFSPAECELLAIGWLRALKAKTQWQGSVMNRRGILALGSGFDEGIKKDLYAKYPGFRDTVVLSS